MTFLEKYSNVKVDALHLINQVNHMIQKYEFSLNSPETHRKQGRIARLDFCATFEVQFSHQQ